MKTALFAVVLVAFVPLAVTADSSLVRFRV